MVPSANRIQVFLVEILHKLHGWHARSKCALSKQQARGGLTMRICAGDMPERNMATLIG